MTKEARIYNGIKTESSVTGVGKTWQQHAKASNWTHTMYKNEVKCIKDLNVRLQP